MEKNEVGRPTAITDNSVQKLLEALRYGSTVRDACYYSGISKSTYYQTLNNNPEFKDKIEASKSFLKMKSVMLVGKEIIDNNNIKLAQWFLEKCGFGEDLEEKTDEREQEAVDRYFKDKTYGDLAKNAQRMLQICQEHDPNELC